MLNRRLFGYYVLAFYALTVAYPIIRVWTWFEPESVITATATTIGMVSLVVLPFALLALRFIVGVRLPIRNLVWVYSLTGICFLLFPVVLVIELIRWLPLFPQGLESHIAVSCVLLLGLYAHLNAWRLRVKTVPVSNASNLVGKSIVQLSDVHIGSRSTKFLENAVKKVQSLNPTWVVITGDLIDASYVGADELNPLRKIADKTLFVTGNHERYEGLTRLTEILESLGIQVLRNRSKTVESVQFVGIDDHDSPEFLKSELERITPAENAYRILLYHRPHGIQSAIDWGFQLMLVGHTHKGQIFPFQLVVKRFFQLTHGTHRFDEMTLHISSGTGTWGPIMRLGSSNEITHLVFQ